MRGVSVYADVPDDDELFAGIPPVLDDDPADGRDDDLSDADGRRRHPPPPPPRVPTPQDMAWNGRVARLVALARSLVADPEPRWGPAAPALAAEAAALAAHPSATGAHPLDALRVAEAAALARVLAADPEVPDHPHPRLATCPADPTAAVDHLCSARRVPRDPGALAERVMAGDARAGWLNPWHGGPAAVLAGTAPLGRWWPGKGR